MKKRSTSKPSPKRKATLKVVGQFPDDRGGAIEAGVVVNPEASGAPREDVFFIRARRKARVEFEAWLRKDELVGFMWAIATTLLDDEQKRLEGMSWDTLQTNKKALSREVNRLFDKLGRTAGTRG